MRLDPDLLFLFKIYLRCLLVYQMLRKGFFALTPHLQFSAPTHERTPVVLARVLVGMTVVLTAALSSIHTQPGLLLTIPAYALYTSLVLVIRQQKLNAMA